MPLNPPVSARHDVSGLVASISRNSDLNSLGQFLEPFRWSVLADFVRPASYPRGHLLISQGDKDRRLFFVETGNLRVDMRTEGGPVQLAIIGAGSVVGEGSFFSHLARNASVAVYSDCKLWEMTPRDFESLARQHPSVALALAMALGATLATRMLDISKRISIT